LNREWIAVEKEIYQNAALNFTMSRNIAQSIREDYSCAPGKVAAVGAGASAPPVVTVERRSWNKRILFVGVEWERKGGPLLIDAFREVLKAHPDAHLTIAGSSPDVDVSNCTVLGRLPLAEMSRQYGEASIFCLPTRIEPFGIAFLEAMMNRLPIVATRIGAIPELVIPGENGHLVEPGAAEPLARALIDLLDHPGRCLEMGEKGHRIAMRDYTWETVGRKIRAHVERALDRGTGKRLRRSGRQPLPKVLPPSL
jgi:glycosyltransferase involved in cell wall biosynthesis